jgi:hypothetical protein
MVHKRAVRIAPLMLTLGACAGSLQQTDPAEIARQTSTGTPAATALTDDELVCTTEKPTGSNIPKRICRTRAVVEKDEAEAQEFVRRLNAPRPDPR